MGSWSLACGLRLFCGFDLWDVDYKCQCSHEGGLHYTSRIVSNCHWALRLSLVYPTLVRGTCSLTPMSVHLWYPSLEGGPSDLLKINILFKSEIAHFILKTFTNHCLIFNYTKAHFTLADLSKCLLFYRRQNDVV